MRDTGQEGAQTPDYQTTNVQHMECNSTRVVREGHMIPAQMRRRRVLLFGGVVALRLWNVNCNDNKGQNRAARPHQVREQERIPACRRHTGGRMPIVTALESQRISRIF